MSNWWFRLYAEFATDPKVQRMSEVMQRRLVMLFCLRCAGNLSDETHETHMKQTVKRDVTKDLCFMLRIEESQLHETKTLFIEHGFIDETWRLLHWEKRQLKQNSSTSRVKEFRKRKKQACNIDETLCNKSETNSETQRNALEENRAEADKNRIEPFPLPPPSANGHAVKKDFFNQNDLAAAAACCSEILGKLKLSVLDQEQLIFWCSKYDFSLEIKPLLYSKLKQFMAANPGKRPASLSYFAPKVKEEL